MKHLSPPKCNAPSSASVKALQNIITKQKMTHIISELRVNKEFHKAKAKV